MYFNLFECLDNLHPSFLFHARFQVKKKQFFRNFMTIILFGVVGTLISFGIISVSMYCIVVLGCFFSCCLGIELMHSHSHTMSLPVVVGVWAIYLMVSLLCYKLYKVLNIMMCNMTDNLFFTFHCSRCQ